MIGPIIKGPTAKTINVNFQLTKSIKTIAPIVVAIVRMAIEKEDPTTVCMSVVSVVNRDKTSPVRVFA